MTDSPINWENLITDSRNIVGENVLFPHLRTAAHRISQPEISPKLVNLFSDQIRPLLDMSMAEDTPSPPPFVEVFCEISGKDYRFTAGTKAEFAVSVINRKLGSSKSKSKALYIEASKDSEEPISFGDGASLVSYGHGWRLMTVIADSDSPGTEKEGPFQTQFPSVLSTGSKDSKPAKAMKADFEGDQSLKYIGRIMFAFVLMFILGGLFTVALENLPRLILLFNNPSM